MVLKILLLPSFDFQGAESGRLIKYAVGEIPFAAGYRWNGSLEGVKKRRGGEEKFVVNSIPPSHYYQCCWRFWKHLKHEK